MKPAELTPLVFFIYHMKKSEPNAMYGSHHINDVWNLIPKILGVEHLSPKALEDFIDEERSYYNES